VPLDRLWLFAYVEFAADQFHHGCVGGGAGESQDGVCGPDDLRGNDFVSAWGALRGYRGGDEVEQIDLPLHVRDKRSVAPLPDRQSRLGQVVEDPWAVARLTPCWVERSFSVGSRAPGGRSPARIFASISRLICT
jgi:hypothetical protein